MTAEEDLPSVNRTVEEGREEEELLATKNAPKTSSYAQQYTSTGNHGAYTDLASLTVFQLLPKCEEEVKYDFPKNNCVGGLH